MTDTVKEPGAKAEEALFQIHPAADLFPMIPQKELEEMARSIASNGLREKITIIPWPDKKGIWWVIDGRNRLAALRMLNVKDKTILGSFTRVIDLKQLGNITVEEYVVMANLERRNLTRQQRKELAGKLAVMLEKAQKDKPKEERVDTTAQAAEKAGVSRRTAAEAKKEAVHAVSFVTPAAVSKPKKKAPASGKMVLPGKALENQQKTLDTLTKYGHNWVLTLLEELAVTTAQTLNLLNGLIAKKKAEAEEKAKEGDKPKLEAVKADPEVDPSDVA